MKHKIFKKYIILLIIVIIAIFIIQLYVRDYINDKKVDKYIAENCPGYQILRYHSDFIDCRGVIAIEKDFDESFVTVYDFSNYSENLDDGYYSSREAEIYLYKLQDDSLYFIEDLELNLKDYIYENQEKYANGFMVDGKRESFKFDSPHDIPIYRKIDVKTGNFTLYKTLDEIPEKERIIFVELSEKGK